MFEIEKYIKTMIQDSLQAKIDLIGKSIFDTGFFTRKIYFCMENNNRVILFRLPTIRVEGWVYWGVLWRRTPLSLLARSNNNIQYSPTLPSARTMTWWRTQSTNSSTRPPRHHRLRPIDVPAIVNPLYVTSSLLSCIYI